jgi:uncharacterized protein YlzI (FlbEa/FlbD family)
MIHLSRLNGADVVLNAEIIESLEAHGNETVINLVTGNRLVVRESMSLVVQKTIDYRKTVYVNAPYLPEFLREEGLSAPALQRKTDPGRGA